MKLVSLSFKDFVVLNIYLQSPIFIILILYLMWKYPVHYQIFCLRLIYFFQFVCIVCLSSYKPKMHVLTEVWGFFKDFYYFPPKTPGLLSQPLMSSNFRHFYMITKTHQNLCFLQKPQSACVGYIVTDSTS